MNTRSEKSWARYRIDGNDRIVDFGGSWLPMTRANGAGTVEPGDLLGRPIWSFIAGEEVQEIYTMLFASARRSNRPVIAPFRCDTADTRRFMEMTVAPCGSNHLDVVNVMLRSEARSVVRLLKDREPHSGTVLLICSWCNRVQIQSGTWMEVEAAVRCLGLLGDGPLPALSHGICSHCRKKALATTAR